MLHIIQQKREPPQAPASVNSVPCAGLFRHFRGSIADALFLRRRRRLSVGGWELKPFGEVLNPAAFIFSIARTSPHGLYPAAEAVLMP